MARQSTRLIRALGEDRRRRKSRMTELVAAVFCPSAHRSGDSRTHVCLQDSKFGALSDESRDRRGRDVLGEANM